MDCTCETFFEHPVKFCMTPPDRPEYMPMRLELDHLGRQCAREETSEKLKFFVSGFFLGLKFALAAPCSLAQGLIEGAHQLCVCSFENAYEAIKTSLLGAFAYLRAFIVLPFLLFVGLFSPETFANCLPEPLPQRPPIAGMVIAQPADGTITQFLQMITGLAMVGGSGGSRD